MQWDEKCFVSCFYDTKSFILNIYEQKSFVNVYNVAESVSCGVEKREIWMYILCFFSQQMNEWALDEWERESESDFC